MEVPLEILKEDMEGDQVEVAGDLVAVMEVALEEAAQAM